MSKIRSYLYSVKNYTQTHLLVTTVAIVVLIAAVTGITLASQNSKSARIDKLPVSTTPTKAPPSTTPQPTTLCTYYLDKTKSYINKTSPSISALTAYHKLYSHLKQVCQPGQIVQFTNKYASPWLAQITQIKNPSVPIATRPANPATNDTAPSTSLPHKNTNLNQLRPTRSPVSTYPNATAPPQ